MNRCASRTRPRKIWIGCYENLLVTKETAQLDPSVVEHKLYASGIGFVRSEIIKGGDEVSELVGITTGNCSP